MPHSADWEVTSPKCFEHVPSFSSSPRLKCRDTPSAPSYSASSTVATQTLALG
jgi:hypothetical protein